MQVLAAKPWELCWVENRTGCVLTPQARGIKVVGADWRIRGMIAYDGWTENAVQAHMAVDSAVVWRHLLRPAFSYPFEEAGKGLLLGIIPAHNARSLAMTRSLGFRESYRIRDGWAPGDDLVVHEMRRDECRWLAQQKEAA